MSLFLPVERIVLPMVRLSRQLISSILDEIVKDLMQTQKGISYLFLVVFDYWLDGKSRRRLAIELRSRKGISYPSTISLIYF